ncbi:hypothetical protein AGOR_G00110480 [Albula goreensis]|uniref:5'-nucleotidase n=1 Tax=Albula goreensis TaxID=1534307 RepID=A0A8T3DLB1_9TELE|nr:hypothetical protein AGOR_G00110480 [Albula goreensis]
MCRVPMYETLDPNKVYKLVLPSYMVDGGDGYSMIKKEKLKHDSGDMDISVIRSYIEQRKKVHSAVEGRIKIFNSAVRVNCSFVLLIVVTWAASAVF